MRMVTSLLLLLAVSSGLEAQEWNSVAARTLVDRGIEWRRAAEADSGLQRYRATARGLVFFLAETGPESAALTRLIKADQLTVEVYWEAPNRSKQNVTAWRDRSYLPTDIRYHRDHLGIVTNDFGDAIRLGDGDEVRDVPHPLSAVGPALYDYALTDSVSLRSPTGTITVYAVQVRPRDPSQPRVAGMLYLDTRTAAIVQFRFSFTPAAYLQADLEDISVALEHALIEQRHWLPFRQEIEIRRRTAWLDVPFRTVIRGRWEIGDYEVTSRIPPARFVGGPYGGLRQPAQGGDWDEPLDSAVARVLAGTRAASMVEVRQHVTELVGARFTMPSATRLALGSISDLARVNRVQGLAIGFGMALPVPALRLQVRPSLGIGTADGRMTGGLELRWRPGAAEVSAEVERRVEEFSQWPVISGVLNTLMAQEGGDDHGDWVGVDRATLSASVPLNRVDVLQFSGGVERSRSLDIAADPSRGSWRPNPEFGAGDVPFVRAAFHRRVPDSGRGISGSMALEAGSAREAYLRMDLAAGGRFQLGPGAMHLHLQAGLGTDPLPAYRSFVLGGRGSLPGEGFRAYGGRRAALVRAEWRVPVNLPFRPGGLQAGRGAVLAPFAAAGAVSGGYEGLPWGSSAGIRPVVGVASELLFQVFRIEAGYALRSGTFGLTIDASPSWWPIL